MKWDRRVRPFPTYHETYAVLAQEARGTREMVTSDQLPAQMDQEALKKMGVEILGQSAGDPLFVDVRLPEGWKKVPCREDSRTTHLVDPDGNRRARMWYKAASYDRKADGGIEYRFVVQQRYFDDYKTAVAWVVDAKNGARRPIHQVVREYAKDKDAFDGEKDMWAECERWLGENYPDWEDCTAYWNLPDPPEVGTIPSWEQRTWKQEP